jgi:hypothetical protein
MSVTAFERSISERNFRPELLTVIATGISVERPAQLIRTEEALATPDKIYTSV